MPQIFVIDSDVDFNWTTTRLLNSHGYRTLSFHDGAEAVQSLREATPDLVLTEFALPSMTGPRLCRFLRGRAHAADTPVIFISAQEDIQSKIQAFAAGGDDYVVKPVDPRELLLRIHALLRRIGVAERETVLNDAPKSELEVGSVRLELETATVHGVNGPYLLKLYS